MTQIKLLDHPSTSRTSSKLCTDVFLHTNMGPLHHQSRTYLEFPQSIMKHETYWYRRLTLPSTLILKLSKKSSISLDPKY